MFETKKEEEGWLLIWNEIDASEFFLLAAADIAGRTETISSVSRPLKAKVWIKLKVKFEHGIGTDKRNGWFCPVDGR